MWLLMGELNAVRLEYVTKTNTVKPVCNDHLYNKSITCDLFSNVI